MTLKCAIVGLPNVGKSTLFNALTKLNIAASNYPFCTIEPNTGMVELPDARLQALSNIVIPERVLPTTVEFVDIAGLVAGASKGEGLGNQFLANTREAHAIVHVVRCFDDDDIIHVSNKVDPISDIETINTELALADMLTIEKAIQKETKKARSGDKSAITLLALLEKIMLSLENTKPIRGLKLNSDELLILKPLCLLTIKPVMYAANVNDQGFNSSTNQHLYNLEQYAMQEHTPIIPICAALEMEIASLDVTDKQIFLNDMQMTEPGLNRLITATYKLLGLQTYFTAGVKEVRAWTVQVGATAPQAAGVIHSDFERGFIRAEVIHYDDFIKYKGEQGAKDHGKMHVMGKDYIVADGDVMHFRFNV